MELMLLKRKTFRPRLPKEEDGRTVPVHVQCSSSPPWSVFCLGVLAVSVFLAHIWEHVSLYQNLLTAYTHPCEPVIDVLQSVPYRCGVKNQKLPPRFQPPLGAAQGPESNDYA